MSFSGRVVAEMPKYKCNKEVWALKIKDVNVVDSDNNGILSFDDDLYADIDVSKSYMTKHEPKAGGYYVVYKDGYESFSPADVFEDGYTLV